MIAIPQTLHPSVPGSLVFFIFTRILTLFTIKFVNNTFACCKNVCTERSFKLFPGWLRTQFVHLEDRYPSFLNECVHLLSVCRVSAIFTLHHDDLLIVNRIRPCSPFEASIPSRHPILSVAFVCSPRLLPHVSCQATHLFQEWKASVLPNNLPACVMQQLCQTARLFSTSAPHSMAQHPGNWLDDRD